MIVAGAGGHALEILDVLLEKTTNETLFFFDDIAADKSELKGNKVLKSENEVKKCLGLQFNFCLGIGNPLLRRKFFTFFSNMGGNYIPVHSKYSLISSYITSRDFDIMKNCFIGPDAQIGKCTIINTAAHIHHHSIIGKFTEISPAAIILGMCKIGSYTSIGANSTILPKILIGSNVIVAAGSVVTKDIPNNCMVAGVPAIIKKVLPALKF